MVDHEVEVVDILPLVGVDKHQVKISTQRGHDVVAVAYVQRDAVPHGRLVEMSAQEVLELVFYLNGVDVCLVVEQSLGKALGRVARVGAQFQDPLGAYHAHEHLEQPPLQVT